MKKSKYFKLSELLPKEIYKDEDDGWGLIDPKLIDTLDTVRDLLGVPLVCNNWAVGGTRNHCGFRPLNCATGAPKSAHKEGKAADLISTQMSAKEMRQIISDNSHLLPHDIRIEQDVDWLHIDTRAVAGRHIYFFLP